MRFPPHLCLFLRHNPHRGDYTPLETWLENYLLSAEAGGIPHDEAIAPADRAAILATGEVWELSWCPSSPVGSCGAVAATLERVLELAGVEARAPGSRAHEIMALVDQLVDIGHAPPAATAEEIALRGAVERKVVALDAAGVERDLEDWTALRGENDQLRAQVAELTALRDRDANEAIAEYRRVRGEADQRIAGLPTPADPAFYLHRLDMCRCGKRRGDHEGSQPQPCPDTGCAAFVLAQAHDPRARPLEQQTEQARRIAEMETALREACDAIDSAHEDQRATGQPMTSPIADRLRAILAR